MPSQITVILVCSQCGMREDLKVSSDDIAFVENLASNKGWIKNGKNRICHYCKEDYVNAIFIKGK